MYQYTKQLTAIPLSEDDLEETAFAHSALGVGSKDSMRLLAHVAYLNDKLVDQQGELEQAKRDAATYEDRSDTWQKMYNEGYEERCALEEYLEYLQGMLDMNNIRYKEAL